jgi:16S rRNA (cytosine967-C5)-methyltransferase
MHPKALLDECASLMEQVFKFDHPADAVVSRYFREHRSLGPRERATLSDTVYAALRERLKFEWFARSGSGSKWRKLAILGFPGDVDFLKSALSDQEKTWLDHCRQAADSDLMAPHRHNLPEWLAVALRDQVGGEFDDLVASLNQPAALDLRVNLLKKKRDPVLAELRQAGLACEPTPYSPLGIRLQGKPSLAKLPAFLQGDIEVQDEGSQLLALLMDAKRGEMVVDFCAGAGGKTLALGAAMRNSGRRGTAWMRSSPGWRAAACPMCTPWRSPMSAMSASSGWRARSTACWWTPLARVWEPCGAVRISNGVKVPKPSRHRPSSSRQFSPAPPAC